MKDSRLRRLRRLRMSLHIFERWLKCELWNTSNMTTTAPKDLEILAIQTPFEEIISGNCVLFLYSESFEVLAEGAEPPFIEPFEYHSTSNPSAKTSNDSPVKKYERTI